MTNGKYNPSLRTDASHLLSLISDFEFVAILVITRNIFDITLPVKQLLQGKSIDVMDGIELDVVNDLIDVMDGIGLFLED